MGESKETLAEMKRLGISQETMDSMKRFFAKTSAPRLAKKRREEQALEMENEKIAQ